MKTLYWSRKPGNFVNKNTGDEIAVVINGKPLSVGPKFTGSVREWYETLVETIIDCSSGMPKATLLVNRNVATILECSCLFRSNLDRKNKSLLGTLCNRYDVRIDNRVGNAIIIREGSETRRVVVNDMNIL